jgi:ADP-dependent NAD(P)H-hydrate dehydratase / NAD(P)H-hydrate epimerase
MEFYEPLDLLGNQHKPVLADKMKEIEDLGASLGVSKLIMMENAGAAISSEILRLVKSGRSDSVIQDEANRPKSKVLFIAGTGNNGGDAFVAARHLCYYQSVFEPIVVLIGKESEIHQEEAKKNFMVLSSIHRIKLIQLFESRKVEEILPPLISDASIIILGIFGTGFHGKPRELQANVLSEVSRRNRKQTTLISVDIPSGLEADTGISDYAVDSDVTVTMHAPKAGMLLSEAARKKCGRIVVANIGLPFE